MAAILRWSNATGLADLVLDANRRIVEADGLAGDLFDALFTDAAPDIGDPVPDGVEALGHWAAQLSITGAPRGSKLWMVRYIRPASDAKAFAKRAAEDALADLIAAGKLASGTAEAEYNERERMIVITIDATLTDDTRRTFQAEVPYAV